MRQVNELLEILQAVPGIIPAITKIAESFIKHDDPVAEAERQATIIAAKEAIRLPFKEHQ